MNIIFKRQPKKYIENCDTATKQRIKSAIQKIPSGDIKKLTGVKAYRLRVGDLRILFDMDIDTITIKSILPRGQVYKRV